MWTSVKFTIFSAKPSRLHPLFILLNLRQKSSENAVSEWQERRTRKPRKRRGRESWWSWKWTLGQCVHLLDDCQKSQKLLSGGQKWRQQKCRRTLWQPCPLSLSSTKMGSTWPWRPKSMGITSQFWRIIHQRECSTSHFPGMPCWVPQTRNGFSSYLRGTWGPCINRCVFEISKSKKFNVFSQSNWGWNSDNKKTEVEEAAAWWVTLL